MHNQKQIRLVLVAYNLSPIFGSIMDFEIWRRTKKTVHTKLHKWRILTYPYQNTLVTLCYEKILHYQHIKMHCLFIRA